MSGGNKASLRSKLESFFTPGPSRDLEDPVDVYGHTHKFFKADKKTDSYADQVEVGTRRLRTGIDDMDAKVYGGRAVSRDALAQRPSYGSEEDDDDDDDMEEMEEDMEEGEASLEEAGSPESSEEEPSEGGDDLDAALRQLKAEEKEEAAYVQERVVSEVDKGRAVRVQKRLFDQFLHQRILMQKLLSTANRLPANLDAFTKVKSSVTAARRDVKAYLKDSVRLQKALFELSETAIEVEEPQDTKLFEGIDANFQRMLPFVEDTIDKWASRTQILKGKGPSKSIIEQVYSLMNEAGNKAKMLERSRVSKDKVFGLLPSEQLAQEDRDVYNDNDFYQALLKDFLATNEGE